MSTLNEITYLILDTVRPENMTNSNITEELVRTQIKNMRALLAKQAISKNGTLPNTYVQSLGCIPLVLADKSECCTYPTGCKILRTSVPIPLPIESKTSCITRVGPVNLYEQPYQNIEFQRVPFVGNNRFTSNLIKWFTVNDSNYIYLLIKDNDCILNGLEVINIQAIIEDPMEATKFTDCNSGVCFSADSRYPIPDSLVPTLVEMVIEKFVGKQAVAAVDKTNDNSTNPETVVNKGI